MKRSLLLVFLLVPLSSAQAAFGDVATSHVNAEAIMHVQTEGIVDGYSDGTFRPESTINRAEFTKIIIGAMAEPALGENCFPDVKSEWFAPYVCRAKQIGLIGGYPDGSFKPGQNVSFVEAAKIIVNAYRLSLGTETSVWYEPFVRALAEPAAIPVSISAFDKPITRGEMAEMIYRLDTGSTRKTSKTYDQLAGITTTPKYYNRSTYPLTFEITPQWEKEWNFFIDTKAPPIEESKGVNLLSELDLSRVERLEEQNGDHKSFLRVHFPKGAGSFFVAHFYDKERAGVVADAIGNMIPEEEIHLEYYVRFPEDFDFSTSGSLPGLGGAITTSEYGAFGTLFGARVGWNAQGNVRIGGEFTGELSIDRTSRAKFSKDNQWHRIDISARLNTVPSRRMNGMLVVEYDGEKIYQNSGVKFRSRAEDRFDAIDLIATIGGLDTFKVAPHDMHVDIAGFTLDKNLTTNESRAY